MQQPSPPANKVDVIIVLGHYRTNQQALRVERAIELFKAGHSGHLLLCGGGTEAANMAKSALAAGLPTEAIKLESQSSTTLENALFSKHIIIEHGWQSAIIVSDGYHLARSWLCFRKTTLKTIKVAATPFPGSPKQVGLWLLALLRELIALPYYLLKTARL